MLNCPDAVASAERSFSTLKLIKTFNRSHMTDSGLSALAMLSIEVRYRATEDYVEQFLFCCPLVKHTTR